MRKSLPKKDAGKPGIAGGGRAERKSVKTPREVVNLDVVFGEADLKPKDLMEAVIERSNMIKALVQVQHNKGAPGVDGLKVEDLDAYFVIRHDILCTNS
jgi:hypothetical protein